MKSIPKGQGGEYYTWYILPKVPKGQGMNTMPDRSCRKFPPKNYNQGLPDISCQRPSPEKYSQGPRDEYLIYPTKGPLLKSIPKGQGINTWYILPKVPSWRRSPKVNESLSTAISSIGTRGPVLLPLVSGILESTSLVNSSSGFPCRADL